MTTTATITLPTPATRTTPPEMTSSGELVLEVTVQEARRLALLGQGLHAASPFGTGKEAVQRCIEQLGYVQIDTISVINRSHHHALWTRVPTYQQEHLDALQQEGRILEYWTHAAAYLPMRDYRFCLPYMNAIAAGQTHWRKPDKRAMRAVLDRVRSEGPLKARDFEDPSPRGDHWGWNWKPAKIALEQLFIEGKLIACRREGFQKVYDLPERVLPADVDTRVPSEAEFLRHLIASAIRAHGLVAEPEVAYLRKGTKPGVKRTLHEMREAGEILHLAVAGQPQPYYTSPAALQELTAKRVRAHVHLLSPFDNLVVQRRRLQQLFNSHYQLECFVPAAKRQFGYYCLPIVHGSNIVGRLDPKADRKAGTLTIASLHLEQQVLDPAGLAQKLARKLWDLAAFNQCKRVQYRPRRGETFGKHLVAELVKQQATAR